MYKSVRRFVSHRALLEVGAVLVLIMVMFLVFFSRYKLALDIPNFYAEDGKVFLNNLMTKNPIEAMLSGFNGYLVVGQYLLLMIAIFINSLFGSGLASLATAVSLVSYSFLALVVSLPYILFRKELGRVLSLMVVFLSAYVPLAGWDYAIVGTVGNLKFAFLYIAFLVVIYRNLHFRNKPTTIICDVVLFLCLLTNVSTFFLIPLILLPYKDQLILGISKRKVKLTLPMISAGLVLLISGLYIAAAYLKGIPKIAGYLDTAYNPGATVIILDRVTNYSIFYPITEYFNIFASLIILGIIIYFGVKNPGTRFVTLFGLWSLNVGAWLFVANRPGISEYFLSYDHHGGPAQFFYASNLIFYFVLAWIIKDKIPQTRLGLSVLILCFISYMSIVIPLSGSNNAIPVGYGDIGTAHKNISEACQSQDKNVIIHIYPTSDWVWALDRSKACER